MKLWLDADAAPREVKEVCYRASDRLKLETILVANQRLQLPVGYAHLSAVRVEGGPDVADAYIAEHSVAGDVAVTADIPLAALLVPKGVVVIDPRGDEYTPEVIGERLSVRDFMDSLRSTGVETGGHETAGKGALLGGYTSNYIRVQFTGGSHLKGTITKVRLLEPSASGAVGEVGGAHFGPQEAPPDADFIPLASFEAALRS